MTGNLILRGQFTPEKWGQFGVEKWGQLGLENGGQFHWNFQFEHKSQITKMQFGRR